MQVEKLILWLSILASSGSLLFHLLLLPNIYNELNELVGLVQGEVQQFTTDTNHAWDALLSLQEAFDLTERLKRTVSEQAVARRQPFISTKQKHNVFFSTRLPAWCQCEVTKPKCPPGARGPPGPNGSPGIPGSDGPPGQDNYKAQSAPLCDLPHVGCVRCPAGPPGRKGLTGGVGRPGPPGAPGVDGIHSNRGRPGKPGPPGNTGKPGRSGPRGDRGNPGRNGVVPVSKPGPLGKMGPAGREGSRGRPGKAGTPGIPGPMGPPGAPGIQGKRAGSGQPGSRGRTGAPGNDATYCPCPSRTMYDAANFKN